MFYFQQLLNTAMSGIDGTAIISTVTNVAFAILLIGFLIGLYQAAFRGGDVQGLVVTAVKYLVVAMIISNWATVFRDVNGSFNTVANFIGNSSGAGDMFQSWMGQLQQQFANNPALTLWDIITGDPAGIITVLLLIVAYVVYALAIIVFCFFYVLFGSLLYVLGPLVLALIPISGIGQLGKSYAINLMIWNAWGILYAVFGALITAIQFNQVNNVLGNGFLGYLKGLPDSTLLGLVSIFYALAVALIPFIAKRIISGDVGSTVYSLVRAGAVAVGAAVAAVAGLTAGAAAAPAVAGGGASAAASAAPGSASGMGRLHSWGSEQRDEQQCEPADTTTFVVERTTKILRVRVPTARRRASCELHGGARAGNGSGRRFPEKQLGELREHIAKEARVAGDRCP